MSQASEAPPREIAAIDRDITAVRRALLSRQSVPDKLSSSDWQKAWDAEPALHAQSAALWRERGAAQEVRNHREAERARIAARRASHAAKGERCATCNGVGHIFPAPAKAALRSAGR